MYYVECFNGQMLILKYAEKNTVLLLPMYSF
jgi:hypothetical protein